MNKEMEEAERIDQFNNDMPTWCDVGDEVKVKAIWNSSHNSDAELLTEFDTVGCCSYLIENDDYPTQLVIEYDIIRFDEEDAFESDVRITNIYIA